MTIVVLANQSQKQELTDNLIPEADIIWISNEAAFLNYKDADAFIDLQFSNEGGRKALLVQLLPKPVIINSTVNTLEETHPLFIRINGWNTFLSSPLTEASCTGKEVKQKAEQVFSVFNKTIEWLPDAAGFVTARVISMIINEAFIALGEGVSSKEEINTAMKLGTAYPYGPFEWAEKIGIENIAALLKKLSETQPRYAPSDLLIKETITS